MITDNFFDDEAAARLRMFPPVLRARDFHLYLQGGARLTDLWQNGGAALLGHKPPGLLRELKNTAERGLFAPFPHPLERRCIQALSRLLPGYFFRLYSGEASLRRALEQGIDFPRNAPFPDPVFSCPGAVPALSLWRPFLDSLPEKAGPLPQDSAAAPLPDLLIPVLPFSWAASPAILAAPLPETTAAAFPPSDSIPPVILAAVTRSIWDLIAAVPIRAAFFPKIQKALNSSLWIRRGIYLRLRENQAPPAYTALFQRFLDKGFLLPPSAAEPLILPGVLSPGEEAKLAELLKAL